MPRRRGGGVEGSRRSDPLASRCCCRPSLRAAFVLLNVFLIASVATLVLTVNDKVAGDALRDLGIEHSYALAEISTRRIQSHFEKTTAELILMAALTSSREWDFPSNNQWTWDAFQDGHRISYTNIVAMTPDAGIWTYFSDNTFMFAGTDPTYPDQYIEEWVRPSPIAPEQPTNRAALLAQTLPRSGRFRYVETHAQLEPTESNAAARAEAISARPGFNMYTPGSVNGTFGYDFVSLLVTSLRTNTVVPGFYGDHPRVLIPFYQGLTRANHPTEFFGVSVTFITLDVLADILRQTHDLASSVSALVDGEGMLLGLSVLEGWQERRDLDWLRVTVVNSSTPADVDVAAFRMDPRCAESSSLDQALGADPILACRSRLSEIDHPALQAASQSSIIPYGGADTSATAASTSGTSDTMQVHVVDHSGKTYYASVATVNNPIPQVETFLLVAIPEEELHREVTQAQNLALGLTVAVVVVVAALSFGFVSLLLRPLPQIAQRMTKAANLEDDDEDRDVSAMAEVAELQEAYYAMNAELNRIRSFVPQSVLRRSVAAAFDDATTAAPGRRGRAFSPEKEREQQAARRDKDRKGGSGAGVGGAESGNRSTEGSNDDARSSGSDDDIERAKQQTQAHAAMAQAAREEGPMEDQASSRASWIAGGDDDTASNVSEADSLASAGKADDASSDKAAHTSAAAAPRPSQAGRRGGGKSMGLAASTSRSLTRQSVTVMILNLSHFSQAAFSIAPPAFLKLCADMVDVVNDNVGRRGGILASFHGDHFVATFNAARRCASHAKNACLAALNIVSGIAPVVHDTALKPRIGIASGTCLVGNVGSASTKAFSTIGPAFTQATVLERLTRLYGPGCRVLGTKRTCLDADQHVDYAFVDIIPLQSGGAGQMRASPIAAIFSRGTAEQHLKRKAADLNLPHHEDSVNQPIAHHASAHAASTHTGPTEDAHGATADWLYEQPRRGADRKASDGAAAVLFARNEAMNFLAAGRRDLLLSEMENGEYEAHVLQPMVGIMASMGLTDRFVQLCLCLDLPMQRFEVFKEALTVIHAGGVVPPDPMRDEDTAQPQAMPEEEVLGCVSPDGAVYSDLGEFFTVCLKLTVPDSRTVPIHPV